MPEMTVNIDHFVADCVDAVASSGTERVIREVVTRLVFDPQALMQAIGTPTRAGVQRIHVTETLTIVNVVWAPRMTLMPHNHNMWAVIGVYGGREDNIFWRRHADDPLGRIEAAGAKSLGPKDAVPLGPEIVHSVTNPTAQFAGAIHVYGGDFFATDRSEWDPQSLEEKPYDIDKNMQYFEDANRMWESTS
jgi:predicted metal-dependent enzyme (double-stranded beta helix superfamily)